MFDIVRKVRLFSALSKQLSFVLIVIVCVWRISPLFWEKQTHSEGPSELIRVLPLARTGERAVNGDLAGVNFSGDAAPLTNNADDVFSGFWDRHPIKDQCSVMTLDRFGNAFPKLLLDALVFPGAFTDKPFELFLIYLHFVGDIGGRRTSGAQQAPEVPSGVLPCPVVLWPR